MSPTQRSLEYLRAVGYSADVCERWLRHVDRRRDLFGVADILAAHPVRRDLLLIQCTSWSNVSARVNKARRSLDLLSWLRAGGRFEVWGWRPGRREPRRVELTGDELAAAELCPRRRRRASRQATLFDN